MTYVDCGCFSGVMIHPDLVIEDFDDEAEAAAAAAVEAHEELYRMTGGHRYWAVHVRGRHLL